MSADPSPCVRRAMKNLAGARLTLERARAELHAAIADAIHDGVRQTDLVTMTGYTRERIRQITREHECPAATQPQPSATTAATRPSAHAS